MRIIPLSICAVTLLAVSGCVFPGGGGGDRGHANYGHPGGDHADDHAGENH